jgi:hypothetical protein
MVPASPVTGSRRVALTAVFVLSLSVVSVRGAMCESIAVVPASGEADPSLLDTMTDELRRLLAERGHEQPLAAVIRGVVADGIAGRDQRTVVGALGVDLLLVPRATIVPEGVALDLAFVGADGEARCARSRIASRASALPQLRAMARRAFDLLAEGSCLAQPETAALPPKVATEKTSRTRMKAFALSFAPTLALATLGFGVAFGMLQNDAMIAGVVIAGSALSVGPSLGHFYSGNTLYGWIGAGGRLVHAAAGTALVWYGVTHVLWSTEYCIPEGEEGHDDRFCDDGNADAMLFSGLVIASFGALWALVDIVLAPILVRDSRARRPDPPRAGVSVTPAAWRSPSGDSTFGLVVVSAF